MKANIGFLAAICIAIVVLIPSTAFAKQKLTKDQVEQIFKTLNANPQLRAQKVYNALDLIVKTMDEVKKDKSISKAARDGVEDLLCLNKYYSMFANTRDLIMMSWSYATSDPSAQIDKGTKLAFDIIEFSAGLALPGGYVRTLTTSAKAALAQANIHNGKIAFTNLAADEHTTNHPFFSSCFENDYLEFAQAWFAKEYYKIGKDSPVTQYGRDRNALKHICDYIKALKTLEEVGLIK